MDYGLYMAASGVSTEMARLDVRSNNLSNAHTAGFRPLLSAARYRPAVRQEDHLAFADSNAMLERLGAGVMPSPTRVSDGQGPLESTERSLDVGIVGKGFLTVQGNDGAVRVTRDGRMAIDAKGRLVLASSDAVMLDDAGQEIVVDPKRPLVIRSDGMIEQDGVKRGRLGIVDVPDERALVPDGACLYSLDGVSADSLSRSKGSLVHQGMVEQSSVDPVVELMGITNAGSAAQRNLRMVGLIAQNMELAVTRLGRVG